MEKFKIEKIDGTIAYIDGLEIEQINTPDFIIFKIDNDIDLKAVQDVIYQLKEKGIRKTFLILPKTIDYCVFKKGEK